MTLQLKPIMAEAGIRQAESQIASAEATATEAASALERTRSLRRSGNASQAVLDQAVATETSARAAAASALDGLGVARAALAQADASRRIARLNLGYARIAAPVDGVVVARTAELAGEVALVCVVGLVIVAALTRRIHAATLLRQGQDR